MEIKFQASLLIKQIIRAVFLLSGVVLVIIYFFSNAPKPTKPIQNKIIANAVIKDYLSNNSGDIDEVVFNAGSTDQSVHFPPHTASQIMGHFAKGDTVTVSQNYREHGPGRPAELTSLQKNDQILVIKNIRPPLIPVTDSVSLDIIRFKFQSDNKNNVTGIITDEYFIPLPPNLLKAYETLPKSITVKGFLRDANSGFVNIYRLRLLKPYSVTINNTHYIL